MTHQYTITGMTCSGCAAKVKSELLKHPEVLAADIQLPQTAIITMQNHIGLKELESVVQKAGKNYHISADQNHHKEMMQQQVTSVSTYKPLIIIFLFIAGISVLTAFQNGIFQFMDFMRFFMAGFFISFSFFKIIDLKGFADAYSTYDLLAKKIPAYGFIYPFIELSLGLLYLTNTGETITHYLTITIMGFSSIGVIMAVLNKKKIRCACLGTVFNLPMTTITIIEDLLMVSMAVFMLFI